MLSICVEIAVADSSPASFAALLAGWTANGIGTFRSGEPFTARANGNISLNGDRWFPDRPNLNPGFSNDPTSGSTLGCTLNGSKILPGPLGPPPHLWYDPCAFSVPAPGTYGNVGRETLTGPGFDDVDASLAKMFKPSERINVQLRAEVFNLLGHANFWVPGYNVFSGTVSAKPKYSGSAGTMSKLVQTPGGRLIQLGLKVIF